ncbi:MAG: hypothetical protein NTV29_18275 [Planctomycetota bacterium]|nr:hypothetical protein [Planctomycetota bacterium]
MLSAMRKTRRVLFVCVGWLLVPSIGTLVGILSGSLPEILHAQDTDPTAPNKTDPASPADSIADWLPETTVLFGKIAPVEQWLEHPLRTRWIETEGFKKLWRSPQALQVRSGIAIGEIALGLKLDQLAKDLSDQGAYVAIDSQSQAVALMLHTRSEPWLDDYIDKAIDYLRKDAKSKGNSDPIQATEYRGMQAYKIQNGIFVAIGPWMLVTNQGDFAKAVIDHKLDNRKGLSQARWYQEARDKLQATGSIAELWVDLAGVREKMKNNDLFRGQANDFGAELILGGVLSVLANTQAMHASVKLDEQGIALEIQSPSDPAWYGQARQHYVGPDAKGHAPNWPNVPGSLATLSTYRDLAQIWLRAGDLFNQNVNDQLAQADNTLTTIFAGKDFGTDILGAIEPELQIFAAERSFDQAAIKPTIQLPGFGMIARLKEPAKLQRELKRTFQSFIGFLNVVGAQEGQPQLEQDTIQQNGVSIYTSQFIVEEDRKYPDGLPIQFNFQPTLAFLDDRVVLCTSVDCAKSILGQAVVAAGSQTAPVQTWFEADGASIQKALQLNSNPIIAQNMVEKGNTRLEAKREFDTLMLILGLVKRMDMSLEFEDQARMRMRLEANLDP